MSDIEPPRYQPPDTLTIVDTNDAATLVGVEPATIRQWVHRGYLTPLPGRSKPYEFVDTHVINCAVARRSYAERARLNDATTRYRAQIAQPPQ